MPSNLHAASHRHCHRHRHRASRPVSMAARRPPVSLLLLLPVVVVVARLASALNQDGVLLLSFKLSLAADPLGSLAGWGPADDTPCAWNGVDCMPFPSSSSPEPRVVRLILPDAQLVGPIAPELGLLDHLRHLDLSGNALNGTIPAGLLRAPELRILSLAGNGIAGSLPDQVAQLRSLRALNLAGNALSGAIPPSLALLPNLTAVSLASNYFSGALPAAAFPALQLLDLSSNLLNGTLPPAFGGAALRFVNLSSNRLAGAIPPEMASTLPPNVTIDLSYNNLTGAIPPLLPFALQRPAAFQGNSAQLCGRPLDTLCSVASAAAADPPNGTATPTKSPPAIAAIPKSPAEALPGEEGAAAASGGQGRMRLATILAIATGDVAGVAVLLVVVLYVYQVRKKRQQQEAAAPVFKKPEPEESPDVIGRTLSCCLRKKAGDDSDSTEEATGKEGVKKKADDGDAAALSKKGDAGGLLVTVDGGVELELETLLKASAYILGAAGSSIVYKAVLGDGGVLAVRRIGSDDASVRRFGELEAQMRAIAKLRHRNILRLRGFFWGPDEMLIIHDFAANGSLANVSFKRKPGSSPVNLRWTARLRIARGVARGLAYLHDNKCVHGGVRPSNILLDADMEPLLADLGIERLLRGGSGRLKQATPSAKSLPELSPAGGASPCGGAPSAARYEAPEAAKKPKASASASANSRGDVYGMGMVLVELVAGRALTGVEVWQGRRSAEEGETGQLLRLVDGALRAEMEGREEAVVSCLRLGFACCAAAPRKRPPIRDVLHALERIPFPSSSSSSSSQPQPQPQ